MTAANAPISLPSFSLEIKVPELGMLTILRPDESQVQKTSAIAKQIFIEAFKTSYATYHKNSASEDSIETWLGLKAGLSVEEWLSDTFEDENKEYQEGEMKFIYLIDAKKQLIGWLSHHPVSPEGDLYLSQCSLAADWRNKKVASTIFAEVMKEHLFNLFPGVKEVKLIARKMNLAAMHLYTGAGFAKDESIDPNVYGDCYNEHYLGYRLHVTN